MRAACLCYLLLSGCTRYRDFQLPAQPGSSISFRWTAEAAPVLTRGAPGEWDAVDVLNPSVVSFQGRYHNLYSGFDGRTWHTGLATSADGTEWQKEGKILSPDPRTWEGDYIAANGHALVTGGGIEYYYQANGIGLARSTDARNWTKERTPVLAPGPRGSWDEKGVGDPYVLTIGTTRYLYYLGQDRAHRQRLGVAISHDGVKWWKLRSNPILELGEHGTFDANGLGEPAVWISHGSYWMLYTGRDASEYRRTGLARSKDGVHWEKLPLVLSGDQPWNAKVLCDPTVEIAGNRIRVWFGGGNVPRPDENINGQIGVGVLEP